LAPDIDAFWRKFADTHWEQRSVLLDAGPAAPLPHIQADELFAAVVACIGDFCAGGKQKVRMYVEDQGIDILGGGHQALLPNKWDGSFEAYNERIVGREGLKDYALVVADWHQFDRALWERILVAVHGLTGAVGVSHSRMDTQVFLGTYKATPFGVHIDQTSGFHFPVVGTKKMRFWPDSFAASRPELHNAVRYERFVPESTAISASPGQAMYWPSSDWHVGESDGRFSVTWGFGYWFGDGMPSLALQEVARMLVKSPAPYQSLSRANLAAHARSLAPIDALVARLQASICDERFRAALRRAWLEHFSACGYLRVPPMTSGLAGQLGRSVSLKPMYMILVSPDEPGTVRVGAGGYSEVFPDTESLRGTIDELGAGQAFELAELRNAGRSDAREQLFDFCARAGTLAFHSG
jgi:hypothetical protein